MADEKWRTVRKIFDDALRQKPEERQKFVNQVCGGDKTLLAEVDSLLSSLGSAESFMETPAVANVADVIKGKTKKLDAGKCFGHYEIIEQIGAGGMGEVYLAKDKKLDRKVAVKILNEKLSSDNANLQRFIREAKAASALNHPNILVIHEIGESQNVHFIVSEHIKGKTLREILKGKSLELSEVLDTAVQIAGALVAAHEANLVHRDIKPENIMIRPDGVVKVLDFGLAKLVEQKNRSIFGLEELTLQQSQTAKGVILGTVSYMSPEQARGKRVDARTDIFSFGTLLYEMLTREQPFTGETTYHTIVAILEKEPPPVSQFINSYPPEIERIIKKCLAKKADERYSAAKVLLDDLKELKEELAFQSKLERSSAPNKKAEAETQIIRAATTAKTEKRNSIAVLPFTNISAEPENEYFCDGLAEELLNALAKIEDLKVAARTSAFSFKNKNTEVSQIGKTLNVKTILEGSVRKSGNRIRISLQLVNAEDGYHLWSERYDREMKDIFDVQDEITLAVVDALKVKLFGEEKAAILKRYTDDPEAYELYLKGLYYCNKWTDEGIRKSIEYFEKALEKDPEFAPAYAKIADYYHFSSHIGLFSPQEILPKWKAAAQRALEIDEGLADAHLAMAHIYFYYDRDWAKAEREFVRAVELNPNSTDAHKYYGLFLASRERFDQAVAEGEKALALDPLSIAVNIVGGFIYLFVDRLDDALGLVRQMIELDSNAPQGYWVGGSLLMANGKYEEAVEAFQKSLSLGDNQMASSKLGCAYGLAGRRDEALNILDQLFEMRERQYAAPFNIARVYAGLGDNDNAFKSMEKAIEEHDADLVFLKRYVEAGAGVYFGENFSTDSRYEDILRRAGLPTHEIAPGQATDETNESARVGGLGTSGEAERKLQSGQAMVETARDAAAGIKTGGIARPRSGAESLISELPRHKRGALLVLAILVMAAAGIAFVLYKFMGQDQSKPVLSAVRIVPFTSFPGSELQPTFSPDGNQIAFAWNGEKGDNYDLHVKRNDAGSPPLRLTTNPADDLYPAWSPDGHHIAFVRQSGSEIGIFLVPALGGPERKLYAGTSAFFTLFEQGNALSWSPDGESLGFSGRDSPTEPNSIFLLSVGSLEKRKITSPSAGFLGDSTPAFSPDGKTLAFMRWASVGQGHIYLLSMSGSGGEPKPLTVDNSAQTNMATRSLAWTADSREIVFQSSSGRLWRVLASGGTPELLAGGGENTVSLAISYQGDRLAYSQAVADTNIWQVELRGAIGKRGNPTKLISSTRGESGPQFSPDGRRIAFASSRSGSVNIWVCDSEGLNPIQLTSFGDPDVGSPRWSPDGRQIAFDSTASGNRDIYVLGAEGGKPRRLTEENADDVRPSWSRDGEWIYFGSNRTGDWQVWKAPAKGGQAVEVTRQGGREAFESLDGKFVYYSKGSSIPGIWRIPATGGEEIRILDEVVQGFWALLDAGIYFVNPKVRPRPTIEFFNFATGRTTPIAAIEKELELVIPSLAISPDGRKILYVQVDRRESDIMLMENFR